MTIHRFFIPAEWLEEDRVTIAGPLVHQIRHVLHLRPGEHIIVLDGSGWEWEVALAHVGREKVWGQVVEKRLSSGEPRTQITLYQSVLRSKRFELVLQKGTELGVAEFVPVISERCLVASLEDVARKQTRWQRIVREAAEQAGRGKLPQVRPALLFGPACEQASRAGGVSLIFWEGEKKRSLRSFLHSIRCDAPSKVRRTLTESASHLFNLFIGPEGGFSAAEIAVARGYGLIPLGLGPRLLRAETAALVAAALVLYEQGEME